MKNRITIERISAAIAASVVAAGALFYTLARSMPQKYGDFIVGHITWGASNKLQDLIALPIFVVAFFLSYIGIACLLESMQKKHGAGAAKRIAEQFIYWSIPFYAGATPLCFGSPMDKSLLLLSMAAILCLILLSWISLKDNVDLKPELFGALLLSLTLIGTAPWAAALLLGKTPIGRINSIDTFSLVRYVEYPTVLITIMLIILCLTSSKFLSKHINKVLFAAQVVLPIFYLTLYPAKLSQPTGVMHSYSTTILFKVLIIILVSLSFFDVVRCYWRANRHQDWVKAVSPLAIFALLCAVKAGTTIPPYLSTDDYHFGEQLLGWSSYVKGFLPYVDYIPAHGVMGDDLPLLLSNIFYDGSAGSVADANRLALALLAFAAFISVFYFSGSILLAFIIVLSLSGPLAWYFLIPFLCAWFHPHLRCHPHKWLIVWGCSCPVLILGLPPQGILLVAASGLMALKMTWDQVRFGSRQSWLAISIPFLIVSALILLTPIGLMLLGSVTYLVENGPINQAAYGIPWALSWNDGFATGLIFELARSSWVGVPLLCMFLIKNHWRKFSKESVVYPAVVVLTFTLLLIPYSMGRIDPGHISRSGMSTIFGWTVLVPILAFASPNRNLRGASIFIGILIGTLLGGGLTLSRLDSSVLAKINVPPLTDYSDLGLPKIGVAIADGNHIGHIKKVKSILDSQLSKDETYLDLTSRNAVYFYTERTPVLPVSAVYNLVSPSQQKRAISNLVAPPKLALMQGGNTIHDGVGLALRSPYIYKFVIENYIPRYQNGFIFGHLKTDENPTIEGRLVAEVRNHTDINWTQGFNLQAARVIVSDPYLVKFLRVGDKVKVGQLSARRIIEIHEDLSFIVLEGGPIPLEGSTYPRTIEISVTKRVAREYRASLFHRSFSVHDYRKIPISWGRSVKSLAAKMSLALDLSQVKPNPVNMGINKNQFKITQKDPQLNYSILEYNLSGKEADFLAFDFSCSNQSAEPRFQLFWWGDGRGGPFEASSVRFTAENGHLIVRIYASPWWINLEQVKGLRLDLDNESACDAITIKNLGLYKRSDEITSHRKEF